MTAFLIAVGAMPQVIGQGLDLVRTRRPTKDRAHREVRAPGEVRLVL